MRSGFVAIVGRANVGKSTLLNSLMGEKISIVSEKAQTTRHRVLGVLHEEEGQIVLVDTPGMHKPRNELDHYMVDVIDDSLEGVDLLLFVVDASFEPGGGDRFMAERIENIRPKFLLLNKIDLLDDALFEKRLEEYKGIGTFDEIMGISAMYPPTTIGLKEKILSYLPEGPPYFPEEMKTDLDEDLVISEIVREKALMYLDEEIPHGIAVIVEEKEEINGVLHIMCTIIVERESHKGIVIGKRGRKLKGIGKEARADLEKMYSQQVHLDLFVKVRKNWRSSSSRIVEYGYRR
ncbi:MAG: GTPase Era [Tissierellia bacterium]|nr:GTPase Era [Tissierellia bacterium]